MLKCNNEHDNQGAVYKLPEYGVWNSMVMRCHWEKHVSYKYYGKRGITVCDRWRKSFRCFLNDMGRRPQGACLDRIDTNGNYEPGNCRWETTSNQSRNKRNSVMISFYGTTMCVTDWENMLGFQKGVLYNRLYDGWDERKALITSPRPRKSKTHVAF